MSTHLRFQIMSSRLLSIVTFIRPLISTEIIDCRNRWISISGFVSPQPGNISNQTELWTSGRSRVDPSLSTLFVLVWSFFARSIECILNFQSTFLMISSYVISTKNFCDQHTILSCQTSIVMISTSDKDNQITLSGSSNQYSAVSRHSLL